MSRWRNRACAATFSTWRSHYAAPCTSPRAMQRAISGIFGFHQSPAPWISVRGLRCIWAAGGGLAMHATTGRDAADVAITTTFGLSWLKSFEVVSYEVEDEDGNAGNVSSGFQADANL